MDYDMIQRVREALNARLDGQTCINIVVPVSEQTAQSMINFLDRALKSGLLDSKAVITDADGTNVPD